MAKLAIKISFINQEAHFCAPKFALTDVKVYLTDVEMTFA
jgi:hypothetical protein